MTENLTIILRGFLLGFSIAAPVGPIGVLCIRRTLAEGRLTGFVSGLGAATADMLYGTITAFGLTAVMNLLLTQQFWLRAVGGSFLLYLGIRTFLAQPSTQPAPSRGTGFFSAYATTFLLTVTNPITILSFLGMFSAILPTDASAGTETSLSLVLGVFFGSMTWWLALSGMVSLFREKFTFKWMKWVNQMSGVIITAFGIVTLAGLVNWL